MLSLYIPDGYRKIEACTCGPNGWKIDFVPNHLWGVSIKEACCIHDWMYTEPRDAGLNHKNYADRVFLNNMIRLVNYHSRSKFLTALRRAKAYKYFLAVQAFGGPSFWLGKNRENNLLDIADENEDNTYIASDPSAAVHIFDK